MPMLMSSEKKVNIMSQSRTIKVDYLARVEGEGAMTIKMKGDQVTDVKFRIFEPPRFFEAFLRGRDFREVPDITARICGICPIAYQMGSINAMENALNITVDDQIKKLRRMIYCGEWIESHALHVFMLHAPDFLGFQDAIQMAQKHPDVVEMGLKIKKIGNDIMTLLGGREIHPINMKVGGFYRVPTKEEIQKLYKPLKWAKDASKKMIKLVAGLPIPEFEYDYEYVSLRNDQEYPICDGRLISNRGIDIDISDFSQHFEEEHVKHSTSLHAKVINRGNYHVGPLARYNLNYDLLPKHIQKIAKSAGLEKECYNPFKSIIVRSIETLYACEEALRIIEEYEPPEKSSVDVTPKASVGFGCTEAPRGICWHSYEIDDDGTVLNARIVPPTSQNQKTIESDLYGFVKKYINLPKDELTWKCEQVIRNYDPCISCSCHFLKLNIVQE